MEASLINLQSKFADWTRIIPESEIRRLLAHDVPYYFAGGKPGVLPCDTFANILSDLSQEYTEKLERGEEKEVNADFNYGPTSGIREFRETLATRLIEKDNLALDPEEGWQDVIILSGSQQGLYAILDIMINPGDVVIVPRPCYLGFTGPAVKVGAQVITVPSDNPDGIIPEYVEKAIELSEKQLGKTPKLLYVVSESDNPSARTLPESRRKALFNIAEQHGLLIVEDSAYREIQFGKKYPPIKKFDPDNERVAYLRTSSKEAAVLRVGYCVVPRELREEMIKGKGYYDLCTPTFTQRILNIYYRNYIDKVLPPNIKIYKDRCEAMCESVDEHFPPGERSHPTGGFFVWFETENKEFDSAKVLPGFIEKEGTIYVPGVAFYPVQGWSVTEASDNQLENNIIENNSIRLGFSFIPSETIREGIEKLGGLLKENV